MAISLLWTGEPDTEARKEAHMARIKYPIGSEVRVFVGRGEYVKGTVIEHEKGEYGVEVPSHCPGASTVYTCRASDIKPL